MENLSAILKNADGDWIDLKNDGVIKCAIRRGDQTCPDEEFVEIEGKTAQEPTENSNIAELFICDVLRAEFEVDLFNFMGVSFKTVLIMGVVSQVSVYRDKKRIVVDDGTSCICCIMDNKLSNTDLDKELDDLYQDYQENPDDLLLKTTIMLKKSMKNITEIAELNIGDYVKIVGKLNEYNNLRCVFVENITVDTDVINDLDNLLFLYENVYGFDC